MLPKSLIQNKVERVSDIAISFFQANILPPSTRTRRRLRRAGESNPRLYFNQETAGSTLCSSSPSANSCPSSQQQQQQQRQQQQHQCGKRGGDIAKSKPILNFKKRMKKINK